LGKWFAYVGVAWYLWDEYCIVVNRVGYTSIGIIAGLEMEMEMEMEISPHYLIALPKYCKVENRKEREP
jgi:hypothetical protein